MPAELLEAAAAPTEALAIARSAAGSSVLPAGVSWETYEALLNDPEGRSAVRLTYDKGLLEITPPPSMGHQFDKSLIGRMLEMIMFDLRLPHLGAGSTTLKCKDLSGGVEPDECYWIERESLVRGKRTIDLDGGDPAPDLIVEVDASSSSIDRLPIHARLGVTEAWRVTGDRIDILLLSKDGTAVPSETSVAFPFLPIDEFRRRFADRRLKSTLDHLIEFHDWIVRGLAPRYEAWRGR